MKRSSGNILVQILFRSTDKFIALHGFFTKARGRCTHDKQPSTHLRRQGYTIEY